MKVKRRSVVITIRCLSLRLELSFSLLAHCAKKKKLAFTMLLSHRKSRCPENINPGRRMPQNNAPLLVHTRLGYCMPCMSRSQRIRQPIPTEIWTSSVSVPKLGLPVLSSKKDLRYNFSRYSSKPCVSKVNAKVSRMRNMHKYSLWYLFCEKDCLNSPSLRESHFQRKTHCS